jgi:RNA polymerase sigma factor (sigma-70 family)
MSTASFEVMLQQVRQLVAHPLNQGRSDGELLRAFLDGTDGAAFEEILRRHGSAVLRVCRRALANPSDAEDVFQATFLFLVRRAATIRNGESLAGWLHGVAYRMAADVRRAADRRRKHEQKAAPAHPADPALTAAGRELQAVLDEEIANLPDTYREPFVLCCLEHLSTSEVAARLGRDEAVVRNRLSRARKLLRDRLARRGVSLTAALATVALSGHAVAAAVPRALSSSTGKVAQAAAAGPGPALGEVPARILTLVEGANKAMNSRKVITVLVLLAAGGLFGVSSGLRALPGASAQPTTASTPVVAARAKPEAKDGPASENRPAEVRGCVLGPDGKPFAGASVVLAGKNKKQAEAQTTGADGRFRLMATPDDLWERVQVVATARRHGLDWMALERSAKPAEITLRLTEDDVPITGRIVDLEGKPVAGATVQVVRIAKGTESRGISSSTPSSAAMARRTSIAKGTESRGISSWVEQNIEWLAKRTFAFEGGLDQFSPPDGAGATATTGKDGRFLIAKAGIGRDRAVVLDVRGRGIERRRIWVVTLGSPPRDLAKVVGLYGPSFEHQAGPAKPASGTVTDKETGKPLAGVRIVGSVPRMGPARGLEIDTVTDARGQYRLDGLPKSDKYVIGVDTLTGLIYLPQEKTVADTEGLEPLRADFALARGSVVEGRILDRQTGKPIRGEVRYFPLPGNDQYQYAVQTGVGFAIRRRHPVGADGSFKLLVSPGPGVVCASGDIDTYLLAAVTEKDAEAGVGGHIILSFEESFAGVRMLGHAYRVIRPGEKAESSRFDLLLEPGRTATGSVTAEGKSAAGVQAVVFRRQGAYDLPVQISVDEAGKFTAAGLDPRKPNLMVFYQEREKRVGSVDPRGDDKGPIAVRLQPWAAVSGRVLAPDGKPVAGASVQVCCRDEGRNTWREFRSGPLAKPVTTNAEGRFTLEGLVPSRRFTIRVGLVIRKDAAPVAHDFDHGALESGETKDLGDLKIPPREKD